MRRGTIRAIAAAAAAATVLTACGGGSEVAADPEPTAPAATEPTAEPVQETSEPVEVPELDLAMESDADVERVIGEILDFRAWLFSHPDQGSLVSRIYWPECECFDVLTGQLADLDQDGQRIVGTEPTDIVSVEITSSTANSRSLVVRYRPAPAIVYGPDGEVLREESEFFPELTEDWLIARDNSGDFRALQARTR